MGQFENRKWGMFPEVEIRLARQPDRTGMPSVNTKEQAVKYMSSCLDTCTVENMVAVMLDTKLKPICYATVGRGNISMACFSVAEIVRIALLSNAACVLCIHNHPSGDPHPSREDDQVAMQLSEALKLFQIDLCDFLVVGGKNIYSYQGRKRGPYERIASVATS